MRCGYQVAIGKGGGNSPLLQTNKQIGVGSMNVKTMYFSWITKRDVESQQLFR